MQARRKYATGTRKKILRAATKIFTKKGYWNTNIREICTLAGCNIAAVGYHFGSKEALYQEAWLSAYNEAIKTYPPDGGVPATAPPEERLKGQLTALLRRITDKDNQAFSFQYREYANPTGLMKLIREHIEPVKQLTRQAIRELLGPAVDEETVLCCEMAIIGQCTHPIIVHGTLGRQGKGRESEPLIKDIETYTRHVVELSLSGLAGIRKAAEGAKATGERRSKKKSPRKAK
jgi:AcrR family transcriptional regulator